MAKYKVLINGQRYKVSMSDVTDYTIKDNNPTEDIIKYRVELNEDNPWEGTIYAHIEKPSQHTLYLISQGRCYITINCRNFIGHSGSGYHSYDYERHISHKSGLGRGSYRFHKHWSLCINQSSLLDNNHPIQINDYTDIQIPIHFQIAYHTYSWSSYYRFANVKGHAAIEENSDKYSNPYREEYYYDIRLALLSSTIQKYQDFMRVYQTKTKITRISFER